MPEFRVSGRVFCLHAGTTTLLSLDNGAELTPLDLVWAKCRGYPSYPAMVRKSFTSASIWLHLAKMLCDRYKMSTIDVQHIVGFSFIYSNGRTLIH